MRILGYAFVIKYLFISPTEPLHAGESESMSVSSDKDAIKVKLALFYHKGTIILDKDSYLPFSPRFINCVM